MAISENLYKGKIGCVGLLSALMLLLFFVHIFNDVKREGNIKREKHGSDTCYIAALC